MLPFFNEYVILRFPQTTTHYGIIMARVITDVQVDEDFHLTVHKRYKHDLPSFGMIGNTERRTKVTSLDMPSILKDRSKNATWFFWTLVQNRNNHNVANFIPKDKAQANLVSKAFKELHSMDIIKRIKRGEYLINPKAYLPPAVHFEEVNNQWIAL